MICRYLDRRSFCRPGSNFGRRPCWAQPVSQPGHPDSCFDFPNHPYCPWVTPVCPVHPPSRVPTCLAGRRSWNFRGRSCRRDALCLRSAVQRWDRWSGRTLFPCQTMPAASIPSTRPDPRSAPPSLHAAIPEHRVLRGSEIARCRRRTADHVPAQTWQRQHRRQQRQADDQDGAGRQPGCRHCGGHLELALAEITPEIEEARRQQQAHATRNVGQEVEK